MTQVFRDNGVVVPVTRVQAGPCVVTQVRSGVDEKVDSVQFGYGEQKKFRMTKAVQGHLKDLPMVRVMRESKMADDHGLKRGDIFSVKIFAAGDKVQVVGQSKGKGFQGVVKRHGFHGSPASHGHKDQLRMPGSIGATDAARVFKGTRMGGRMGNDQVTVKNLEIVEVNPEQNELLIKGALPGARGGLVVISSADGKIELEQPETEAVVEETKNMQKEVKDEKVSEPSIEEVDEKIVDPKE